MSTGENAFVKEAQPAFAPAAKRGESAASLCSEIMVSVSKEPGDHVTCTWIHGNSYRINWWASINTRDHDNPLIDGLHITMQRIRKSEFLDVRRTATGLAMKLVTRNS